MNQNINWEEWEKKMDIEIKEENLKKSKSGSILFIKDIGKLGNWHHYIYHWEKWLTTDYWKNWQEKINNFQTSDEVHFYTDRLRAIMEFVQAHTKKDCFSLLEDEKPWDPVNTPKLIEQELKRMENISKKDFEKTDKWSKVKWKEITDPQEMVRFFGELDEALVKGEIGKRLDKPVNYESWTKEQLEGEKKKITSLIAELKKTENLNQSQVINRNSVVQQLERVEKKLNLFLYNNNNEKPWPIIPIVSTLGLIALLGLIVCKVKKNKVRK